MPVYPKDIPLHCLDTRAKGGLEVGTLESHMPTDNSILQEHRDDHYIIIVLTRGHGTMFCDMERISSKGQGILLIKPFQVHAPGTFSKGLSGYFLSIAPFLMPAYCHNLFQQLSVHQQYMPLLPEQHQQVQGTAKLLHDAFQETHPQQTAILKGLFQALTYRIAGWYTETSTAAAGRHSRAQQIHNAFRQLLAEHSFTHTPAFFAGELCISTAHLNDCVRSISGFSVTYWLQDALLTEAKRLLYYTNSTVKEIAYDLGFEDHTYFSRLFKKISRETPLSFRNRFRE